MRHPSRTPRHVPSLKPMRRPTPIGGAPRIPMPGESRSEDPFTQGDVAERRGDLLGAGVAYAAVAESADPAVAAAACFRLGRIAWRQGRLEDALTLYERARSHAADAELDEIRASAENGIGAVHSERGAYAQARACYRVALGITRDDRLRARIQLNQGVLAAVEGQVDEARDLYAKAVTLFETTGDDPGLAVALRNLGMLEGSRGGWEVAAECYARCLVLWERQGDCQMIAKVLLNLAELACARGAAAEALPSVERSLALYTEAGDERGRCEAFRWMGHALRRLERRALSAEALRESVRLARRMQSSVQEAEAARELAQLQLDEGNTEGAVRWLARARERYRVAGASREAKEVAQEMELLLPSAPAQS
jgi:tetratricopeptide (TPR) repeat protein